MSDGLKSVPPRLATECYALTEVKLPANAETIGQYAFYRTALTSIDLPESLRSIGSHAFYQSDIESVVIPQNVSTIGSNVFYGCTKLKRVVLNSRCQNMNYTFRGCSSLETVILPCATPPSITNDPFGDVNKSKIALYVPDFALESYKADPYWYNFTNTRVSDEASVKDYWAILGNLTLSNAHKMQGTPSVEIMRGGKLTVDTGTQQNFNKFTFNTSEAAPGCFLSNSNSVKANKIETSFYVANKNTWYFFSPVVDVKMSDVTYPATDSWVIRYYDGARRASQNASSGNWVNVPADGTLHRGQGYIIQATEPGWLYMPVATTEHDKILGANEVTLNLADNPCETAANAGWNFIANPYPTYFDIYYIDMQAPVTVWTGSTYRAYSLNDGDRGDDTFVLRPMQPYFVQKASAELAARMPLHGRRTSTVIDRSRVRRHDAAQSASTRQKLNLELSLADNEDADDYTSIVINEEASTGYETVRDASKFMSLDNSVAQIWSLGEKDHPMAINERPVADGVVNLGVYLPQKGVSYRIKATRTDRRAWLYDAECDAEYELSNGDYIFTSSKSGNDNDRFSIRFTPIITGVESADMAVTKVTGNTGSISVLAPEGANVTVYATDGRAVANVTADGGNAEILVPAGIYIVKVNAQTFKTIVK
ncbi:MAG: leucine-rich repeat domain-containing protein [Muribaculaceae bacterium]|nr:leucine-rich repeat domain-containing protein [Muribaculaceae bacterium]